MSHSWAKQKLGEVITLEYGKPLPEDQRCSEKEGVPAFGANGIKCYARKPHWQQPSIIIGRKGTAGAVTLVEGGFWPLDVTYYVTFDDQRHDRKFLYYMLSALNLPALATGVKPGINRNVVYALEQYFPRLPEQKRIVAILDEAFAGIDAAIANTEKNLANARELFESYLSTRFTEAISDFEEVPLDRHIKFIDYRGKTPKKTKSGLRLITAKNVRMGFLQTKPEEFVSPDTYDAWMTRGIPSKGDVLFTTEAPLGFVCQLDTDQKVVFAQRIITMQPDRNLINPAYLKFALRSAPIQLRIHEKATGATATGIKASLLKKINIPLPDLSVQQLLVNNAELLEQQVKEVGSIYQQKLTALAELKQSLLQKAFSGELTAGKVTTEPTLKEEEYA